jgi:hypothetical protein
MPNMQHFGAGTFHFACRAKNDGFMIGFTTLEPHPETALLQT